MPKLHAGTNVAASAASRMGTEPPPDNGVLRVTGRSHVMNILEAIEDGRAADLDMVEPWLCDAGCFGSPLMADDPFLARRRWSLPDAAASIPARAIRRLQPLTPRKGLRLDADMTKAIQKLAKIDKLARRLPGCDCGICGAPTCAALAEDIVLGRASPDACPRQGRPARPGDEEKAT